MGSICSYLCCGCCGRSDADTRRMLRTTKKKNLKILNDITPPSKLKEVDNPLDLKTTEMTDFYKIPTFRLKTEADVLKQVGYEMGAQFDTGGFATVHTAVHIEKALKVALKRIPIPEDLDAKSRKKRLSLLADIKNELYVLQKTNHPNVVKMIQHFIIVNRSNRMAFFIIMQLAQGGNLSNKLDASGPFTERQCKRWFAQMLSGLNYMHSKGIAHRDLKLANILLDEVQDVLISDFGLSRFVWRESVNQVLLSKTYCGTPPYMAPEVLDIPEKKEFLSNYEYDAFKADIWSLGVIAFKLFNKRYPFDMRRGPSKAAKAMRAKKWHFAKVKEPPTHEFKDIISQMLEPETDKRIQMKVLTQHSWIKLQFKLVEEKNNKKTKKLL